MTEWGPKIERGSNAWLASKDRPAWNVPDSIMYFELEHGSAVGLYASLWSITDWNSVSMILLPADHPYYAIIAKGYVPFTGDTMPADASGAVLLKYGISHNNYPVNLDWSLKDNDREIVGYKRKAAGAEQPAPADTVTIARVSKSEANSLWENKARQITSAHAGSFRAVWLAAYRHLGLIRDETEAERLAAEHDVPLAKVEAILAVGRKTGK